MESKLISASEILKKGWDLFTRNLRIFLLPIAVMLPPYILMYLFEYVSVPGQGFWIALFTALSIFVNIWMSILFIDTTNKILKNQPIVINDLFQSSFHKIPSYLLVVILVFLIVMAGTILLIIPGIIFGIWYSFANYINVLETTDNKGIKALKSSKELVSGRWWQTLWRLAAPSILIYAVFYIAMVVIFYMVSLGGINMESFGQNVLFNSISSLVALFLAPLYTAFGVILYSSLKETKISQPEHSQSPINQSTNNQ